MTEAKHIDLTAERGIVDDIKHLIEIIKDQAGAFIQKLVDEINKVIGQIQEIIPGLIQQIKDKVQEEINKLKQLIQTIIDEAVAAGKDVQECVDASQSAIEDLQNKLIEESEACVKTQLDQVTAIITDAQNKANELTDKVQELIAEISNCSGLSCVISAGSKVFELVGLVKNDVTAITQEVSTLVQSLNEQTAVCLVNVTKEVALQGKQVVDDIQTCVANKV